MSGSASYIEAVAGCRSDIEDSTFVPKGFGGVGNKDSFVEVQKAYSLFVWLCWNRQLRESGFVRRTRRSILFAASDPQVLHGPWMSNPIGAWQLAHHHGFFIARPDLFGAGARAGPDATIEMLKRNC